jgi:hypothetical protein
MDREQPPALQITAAFGFGFPGGLLIVPLGIEPPIQELVIDGVSQVNRQRSFIRLKITQKEVCSVTWASRSNFCAQ